MKVQVAMDIRVEEKENTGYPACDADYLRKIYNLFMDPEHVDCAREKLVGFILAGLLHESQMEVLKVRMADVVQAQRGNEEPDTNHVGNGSKKLLIELAKAANILADAMIKNMPKSLEFVDLDDTTALDSSASSSSSVWSEGME